jgi:hypothetical protein
VINASPVRAQSTTEARPTLTLDRPVPPHDPQRGAIPDAGASGRAPAPGRQPPGGRSGKPPGQASSPPPRSGEAPGLRTSVAQTRAAVQRLVGAHVGLLRAEFQVAAREVAIIAGLAALAFALAVLLLILVWVGTWLFVGEWLFGSIGWGILHGTLFTIALMAPIGLNLAGGPVRAWVQAFVISLVLAVVLSVLFASNVIRTGSVWLGQQLQASLSIDPAALPTLAAAVVGAVVLAVLFLALGTRAGPLILRLVGGLVLGLILGAIFGSVTFDTKGAIAVAITVALLAWIALAALLALRGGIDPRARYEKLIPRASMAQLAATRAYLEQQWQRQRKKLSSR